jgi:hypothetical protein
MSFVKFIAEQANCTDEQAKQIIQYMASRDIHNGECVGIEANCHLCFFEDLLSQYRVSIINPTDKRIITLATNA